jgi:hypothetical protein
MNADITGTITATSGSIGGWNTTPSAISSSTGNTTLSSNGKIAIHNGGGFFEMGGDTVHPHVSGLNVESEGIVVRGGIQCTNIGGAGGSTLFLSGAVKSNNFTIGSSSEMFVGGKTLSEWTNNVCDVHDASLKQWVTDNFKAK